MFKSGMLIFIAAVILSGNAFSQRDSTTEKKISEISSFIDELKKLKISGYVQAQFQSAQQDGIASFAGGDFPANVKNRFSVRRGRLKLEYNNEITQYVFQIDMTERGVGLKDIYARFNEPWLKMFGFTAGVFNRPFGFELGYSSSSRETPERSRVIQTIFPGERDLGFMISVNPGKQIGMLNSFDLAAGIFAGNGPNPETDNQKDFIGRLGVRLPVSENFSFSGGVSGYFGNVRLDDGKRTYTYSSNSSDTVNRIIERQYLGADAQLSASILPFGKTVVRGEFITGTNPGTLNSSSPYRARSGDIYLRNFSGYYAQIVQDFGKDNQFTAKYDVYDPDKEEIISSLADHSYATLGFGWIHHLTKNVKLLLYYDMVKNKTASEDQKDNVMTLRMQVKF